MLIAAPSMANARNITEVELDQAKNQLDIILTGSKKAEDASFFSLRKENVIEANLINKQENPLDGVKSLEINQIDQEHTQILINTETDVSIEHLLEEQGEDLVLSLNRVTKAQSLQREVKQFGQKTVKQIKQTYKSALGQKKTKDNEKSSLDSSKNISEDSDILIPNPEIVISNKDGTQPKEQIFQAQDSSSSEATLPRAVAPPVGDMAVSNINTMPDLVDLGSGALVPRLVLRDAPVREVLSLLARSANLNVVFANGKGESSEGGESGPIISLDLENQPVQEVFNSVLLVAGLDANRRGNIIYVGEELPASARNLVSRTVRLNQVSAENAALYLASQGATGKRLTNEAEEIIDPDTGEVISRTESSSELSDLDGGSEDETGIQALLLKGLQVSTDERLNSITLVGEPRKVEVASGFLTQLDARRRQVAVNVKVIDVNLLNEDVFNSSFSFGVNDDAFLVQDNGAVALNLGGVNPPETATVTTRAGFPRVTPLPIPAGADLADSTGFLDNLEGAAAFDDSVISSNFPGFFARGPFGSEDNPFQPGVTETSDGDITFQLPTLNEVPEKFLALLESRITSGNAKILTDPTLTVQEGQQARVKLTQRILSSIETTISEDSGFQTNEPEFDDAGITLSVNVERIDDNGFVSMSVSPRVTAVGQVIDFESATGVSNPISLLSERELNSGLIRLRDGQTLILSGIIQDQERSVISKVPILGDIPLLGSLFRSSEKTNERAEVIVLLTPEIIEEDAGLASNFTPSKESRELLNKSGVGLLKESAK